MSRIRAIKPDFFRHVELFEAERATGMPLRVAFAGMWTVADREGRFRWRPRVIKLDVLPFDEISFEAVLDALAERGFIVKYEVGGEFYGCIPTFTEHQHVNQRESPSDLPAHDCAGARTCENIPAHGEQEGEQEGEQDRASHDAHAREALDDDLETFWHEYPHKVGKPAARRALPAAIKRAGSLNVILDGLARYRSDKPPRREWLNPATFLNQDRWNDQPAERPNASPNDAFLGALARIATQGDGDGEWPPDTGNGLPGDGNAAPAHRGGDQPNAAPPGAGRTQGFGGGAGPSRDGIPDHASYVRHIGRLAS